MRIAKSLLKFLLVTPVSILFVAATSMMAHATTYTWTQNVFGTYDWTIGGNWSGSTQFVSDPSNDLVFYADTTTVVNTGNGTITINNVPTLSMKTLTLNGKGPNGGQVVNVNIGDNSSTWTIGDGSTATISYNATQGGGHAGLDDIRYTINPNIILNAPTTTFNGNGYSLVGGDTFTGNITQATSGNGITKSGTSTLVFSGNNSYSGTTLVSGGVLRLSSVSALPGGIGSTGGTSALTLNGGVLELGAGNFQRNLGAGSSQFQITGGTSGFSAYDGPRIVTVNGDASQELQWGSATFAPTTLVLNAASANNSIELANKIDLNAATRTVLINADKALLSGVIRTATGTAGLTKTGNGTLVLTGNNSYNGTTTISAGTLSIGASNNLGTAASLVLNGTSTTVGGTLQIRGTALTSFSGLATSVGVTAARAVSFEIQDAANTFTIDQVLNQTTGTLTKSGAGTLVLNKNNTFTGATTVTGGTLVLDYSDSINGNGSKLSDTAALTLSGSALVLKGGSHTEVVGSTTLSANTASSISRDSVSPGSAKISLGAITTNTASSLSISEANLATTTTANVNNILPLGRLTVGANFGANANGSGTGDIVAYTGYTNYTPATATTGSTSVVNQLTGGGTLANSLSSYSLRIANSGNSDVLELGSKTLTLINNGTFLYAGGGDNNYSINGTGSIGSASGNQVFTINTYTGTTLTVNAKVSGNVAPVLKAGQGTLVLGGNSSAGTFYVQEGVVRVTNSNGLGNTSNGTNVQSGAALELAKDIANNNISIGAEALSLNGAGIFNAGALRNKSGDNNFAGAITIGASGARINSDANSSLTLTGGIVTALTQDVTFGGAGNTTVSTAAISGSGSLIKDGTGTVTLSAANSYTGATTVSDGKLTIASAGTIGSTRGVTIGTASTAATTEFNYNSSTPLTQSVSFASGSTGGTLSGSGTINTAVNVTSGNVIAPGNSAGTLNLAAGLNLGSNATFNWEHTAGNAVGTATTDYDTLNVTGTVAIDGIATTGSKLKLLYGLSTDFTTSFWDANQTWNIITGATSINNGFDISNITVFIGNTQQGGNNTITGQGAFTTAISGSNLQLNWTATASVLTGVWSNASTPTNYLWTDGTNWTGTTPANASDVAQFTNTGLTTNSIDLNGNKVIGKLQLNTSVGTGYTIGLAATGNTLTLNNTGGTGAATLEAQAGTHLINAKVVTAGTNLDISTTGAASLTLVQGIDNTAGKAITLSNAAGTLNVGNITNVTASTLSVTGSAAAGTIEGASGAVAGSTTLTTNAALTATRVRQDSVTISGSAGNAGAKLTINATTPTNGGNPNMVSRVNSLSISGTTTTFVAPNPLTGYSGSQRTYYGTLDLQNNDLIMNNVSPQDNSLANSQLSLITDYLRSGASSTGNLSALDWAGKGINTSYGLANSALGVIRNVMDPGAAWDTNNLNPTYNPARYSSWGDQSLGGNEILVKHTWYGDFDLDGTVTSFDFALLDAGFAGAKQYDSTVGWFFGDANYNGIIDSQDYSLAVSGYNAYIGASNLTLPEPSSLLLCGLSVVGLLTMCRRRCPAQSSRHSS